MSNATIRCGVCGGRALAVSLHRHTLAAALRGGDEGPPDLQWTHREFTHVIAAGSALPGFASLVACIATGATL